jgi:hypothetical protein
MRSTGTGKSTSDHTHLSEEVFRAIWRFQDFPHTNLLTTDGRPVTIFSPGTPNEDGGPDFSGARIRIGHTTFFGEVELHLSADSWFSHHHHLDSHYNGVILHVALDRGSTHHVTVTASRRSVPLLILHPILAGDDPRRHHCSSISREQIVRCAPWNSVVSADALAEWFQTLGLQRVREAVRRTEDRLHELVETDACCSHEPYQPYRGHPDETPPPSRTSSRIALSQSAVWDQLLYEALMEGVGFTKNRRPFHALAGCLPLHVLRRYSLEDLNTQLALMFGTAGLLPASRGLPDPQSRKEVRQLRKRWKELRPSLLRPVMHEAEWLFFRLRPANFPTARLATVCHLLPVLFRTDRGFGIFLQHMRDRDRLLKHRIRAMRKCFTIEPSPFWQTHTHFRGRRPSRGVALGTTRKNEILVNGISPLFLLWAQLFGEDGLASDAMELLKIVPASHSRSLETMNAFLIRGRIPVRSALDEQGVLECYNRYCRLARCTECAVGMAVEKPGGGGTQYWSARE